MDPRSADSPQARTELARFQHYSRTHRIVAWISQHLFRNITYKQRHGLIRGMRRKGGLGFIPIGTETREEAFLRTLALEGKVVYDIGAFEGLLTMFFAKRADFVIAFEPNPQAYAKCLTNLRLNRLENVQMIQEGVSDAPGTLTLVFDSLMPGGASAEPSLGSQIRLQAGSTRSAQIRVLSLDEHIAEKHLRPPDFIKIDIEGMEYPALVGMSRTLKELKPDLYIELHGATIPEKWNICRAVLGLLAEHGYEIQDAEEGRVIGLDTLTYVPAHIYATAKGI